MLNNTPDSNYTAAVSQVANVREWMTYFAVLSLMEYSETSLGCGEGDDYALYRGLLDPRFQILSHDFDTIFKCVMAINQKSTLSCFQYAHEEPK